MGELKGVFLPLFIDGTFHVEERVCPAKTSTGVAKNIQIHNLFIYYRRDVRGYSWGRSAVRC